MRTVIGLFNELGDARRTAGALKQLGLRESQISVVSPETEALSSRGAGLDLNRMDVAGLGQVAACGPMTTYLTPSAAGTGGDVLRQALTRMGLTEDEARQYVDGVKRGYTLETAVVEDDKADQALAIMRQQTSDLQQKGPQAGVRGEATTKQEGDVRVPVAEEEIAVGKRQVSRGGVRVSTHVISKPIAEEITLREDTVGVERRSVDRPADEGAFQEQTIEVAATGEEPVVEKRAKVVEEVVIRKDTQTRTETIRDTVRRTDVDVENIEFDPGAYQEHFQANYAKDRFDDYAPAYQFGEQIRSGEKAGDWTSVESNARTRWEKSNPGTWERFKGAIRHAWERAKS